MKKYLVLTSVLALAACGGGSGGGGAGAPAGVRAAVDPSAVQSNSAITSMASEILVASDGSAPVLNIARSGSVVHNGKTYTSYRLDDVNFRVATGANDANLKFHMDNIGKIDSLVMNVGTGNQYMDRRGDTNEFRGIVYEYVVLNAPDDQHMDDPSYNDADTKVRLVYSPSNDLTDYSVLTAAAQGKCPAGKSCRWDRIDQAFRVSSEGTDFKYSDFGKLETDNFGKYKGVTAENLETSKTQKTIAGSDGHVTTDFKTEWSDLAYDNGYETFAGGYAALQKRPTNTMEFTGKATGSVYATDMDSHADEHLALQDNNASLVFTVNSNGSSTETLSMAFDNWYDVTVTKTNATDGTSTNQIVFNDFDGANNYMKFNQDAGTGVTKDNFATVQGDISEPGHAKTEGLLDMNYYGVATTEEATGTVRYKETANVGGIQHEREFNSSYGMKP